MMGGAFLIFYISDITDLADKQTAWVLRIHPIYTCTQWLWRQYRREWPWHLARSAANVCWHQGSRRTLWCRTPDHHPCTCWWSEPSVDSPMKSARPNRTAPEKAAPARRNGAETQPASLLAEVSQTVAWLKAAARVLSSTPHNLGSLKIQKIDNI